MIITCPHCQTKYQVTYEAIGSAGRKVQCAHCHQAWQQAPVDSFETPPADALLDPMSEDALDEAMASEARAHAATVVPDTPRADRREKDTRPSAERPADLAALRKQERAFSRRQHALAARLPLARFRRSARWVALLLLCGTVAVLYWGRVEVVRRFPAMAALYEAAGLPVNVVGLEFAEVETLRTLRDGKDVLSVSAQLVGVMPEPTPVPPVVVTLLDAHGAPVYEWSITPAVRDMMAGERSSFNTQLDLPPDRATQVRLSFAGYSGSLESAGPPGSPRPPHTSLPAEAADPAPAKHGAPAPAAPDHPFSQEHH